MKLFKLGICTHLSLSHIKITLFWLLRVFLHHYPSLTLTDSNTHANETHPNVDCIFIQIFLQSILLRAEHTKLKSFCWTSVVHIHSFGETRSRCFDIFFYYVWCVYAVVFAYRKQKSLKFLLFVDRAVSEHDVQYVQYGINERKKKRRKKRSWTHKKISTCV